VLYSVGQVKQVRVDKGALFISMTLLMGEIDGVKGFVLKSVIVFGCWLCSALICSFDLKFKVRSGVGC